MERNLRSWAACAVLLLCFGSTFGQVAIKGKVLDGSEGFTIIGASILEKGSNRGVNSDYDGNFEIEVAQLPATIVVSFIGYISKEINVTDASKVYTVNLGQDLVQIKEAEIVAEIISDKQRQEALTMETMDVQAIKEAPSGSFYEGLGNLKGVDLTSASLGFKIINTRGFNSTSPVRSLQLIDGVDNQSPGLNFSLGNFLGASDLDVKKVDIIAGASSAFFGPGAFNGVINMETKDPFLFPGFSMSLKVGERSMFEQAFRLAHVVKNKEGEDKFGLKINFYKLNARDWEAENYDPIFGSEHGRENPFGYDAVNIYGDEPIEPNNDYLDDLTNYQGLGVFYRNGYKESDLVDYNTDNVKMGTGLYYKIKPDLTLNYNLAYSTGTTVYQGDNRYRLKNIQFLQNKLELSKKDNWFIRAYNTTEDAGETYDIVTTAIRLQDAQSSTQSWNSQLGSTYRTLLNYPDLVSSQPTYANILSQVQEVPADQRYDLFVDLMEQWYLDDFDFFSGLYQNAVEATNNLDGTEFKPFYEPGTQRFDNLFNSVTSRTFAEGGSRFYDKSDLYHVHGEKKFDTDYGNFTTGANARWYTPDSRGTIFSDTLEYIYADELNAEGQRILLDSTRITITNQEWGAYAGWEKQWDENKWKTSITARVDKNQNFKMLFSPAASVVYSPSKENTIRFSFSSAIRNPTLADQYLYYNVGRAILLGNIDGRFEAGSDSLITLDSFSEYRNSPTLATGVSKLEYFNIDRIRPEKVRTAEIGYRGTWWNNTYIDASYYLSFYTDFIGYNLGLSAKFDDASGFPLGGIQAFRVAANAQELVTTQGFSVGINYYFKKYGLKANYSWNKLVSDNEDPIIPAFNTPEHKYNLGFSGRDLKIGNVKKVGFGINYKWVQGFLFEGSPQFTGDIPTYDQVDAQVNVYLDAIKSTLKIGGSNIFGLQPFFRDAAPGTTKLANAFDNKNLQVYGGPRVGRLIYVSLLLELRDF